MPSEQSLDEKSDCRQRRGLKESDKHVGVTEQNIFD
jgi:hypothetical protein